MVIATPLHRKGTKKRAEKQHGSVKKKTFSHYNLLLMLHYKKARCGLSAFKGCTYHDLTKKVFNFFAKLIGQIVYYTEGPLLTRILGLGKNRVT